MISDTEQQRLEIVDQEKGVHDGVSLAYNIGTDQHTLAQALDASKDHNEFYIRGMIEGFALVIARNKYVRQNN